MAIKNSDKKNSNKDSTEATVVYKTQQQIILKHLMTAFEFHMPNTDLTLPK